MPSESGRASTIELVAAANFIAVVDSAIQFAGVLELHGHKYAVIPLDAVERIQRQSADLEKALKGEMEKVPHLTGMPE